MDTSPAVHANSYDSTDINKLKTHEIVNGHARCDEALGAIFHGGNGPVTCKKCTYLDMKSNCF